MGEQTAQARPVAVALKEVGRGDAGVVGASGRRSRSRIGEQAVQAGAVPFALQPVVVRDGVIVALDRSSNLGVPLEIGMRSTNAREHKMKKDRSEGRHPLKCARDAAITFAVLTEYVEDIQ
jgi:hypothetical protein